MLKFKQGLLIIFLSWMWLYASNVNAAVMLQDLNGNVIPFHSLQGKWVFINYWASWCNPCVDEISSLNRLYERNPERVAVFAVNYDVVSISKQLRLIKRFNIHYPSLKQRSLRGLPLDNISVVPVTFVFNPKGELATTLYGGQTLKSLTAAMN